MSNLSAAELAGLVSWEEFQRLPERPDNGKRFELHDGVVAIVPPARPLHLFVQMRLPELLRFVEDEDFVVVQEFPYRPARNYQFWFADVAVLPRSIRNAMRDWTDYEVYAPPLVIEILSPSNTKTKVDRQRVASMSNGTREFWIIDAEEHTVHVTCDASVHLHQISESIQLTMMPGKRISVASIFAAE